jgi:hypothetical protein
MPVVNPHVHTEQEILNSSFDETTGVLGVLPLEYDPSGATKRSVTDNLSLRYEISGSVIYLGEATIGSAESGSLWRIQEINTGTGKIKWADGNDSFDNIWDNRAILTYT